MAQWIKPRTLNGEVHGSNLLETAVSAHGQGTLSSLPSPSERTYSRWSPGCLLISSFLSYSGQLLKINKTLSKDKTLQFISSAENQKGVNDVKRCSVENQKGAIAIKCVQQ